uniref:Phospholipase B-like n=1 Tax=Tetraselmis chuii TaxID=63592 RepID=A0A7S1XAJ7_9CHLO|mmetsp:Transcript_6441/g.11612  ORF Transcript_6441/g.11612 Transcript_6441/m.11612 type:complete len:269 (+) Transcript_6441:168-974(+)
MTVAANVHVLLVVLALAPVVSSLANPETVNEISQEPVWNSGAWIVDKTYYSTWAHFHACVTTDTANTLDELRTLIQEKYFPLKNGRTVWDLFRVRSALVPTSVNETVADLVWPYQRNHLTHARPMCVAGATPEDGDACCCKARASWGLYARFNSEYDALWVHQEFRNFQDWDANYCVGLESSGVDAEWMDSTGYIRRQPMDAEYSPGSSVGGILGGIFGGLACIALVAGGVFLWQRRKKEVAFAEWRGDDHSVTGSDNEPYMPEYKSP